MIKRWTQLNVDKLQPTDKLQRHFVGGGLILLITPRGKFSKGTKGWATRYKVAGITKQVSLGSCDTMTLKDAHAARDKVALAVRDGRDPLAEADAARTGRLEAAVRTVEVVAREWIALEAARKWLPNYATQVRQRLEKYVFPVIGRTPVNQVTRSPGGHHSAATQRQVGRASLPRAATPCLHVQAAATRRHDCA